MATWYRSYVGQGIALHCEIGYVRSVSAANVPEVPNLPFQLQASERVIELRKRHWWFLWPHTVVLALTALIPPLILLWFLQLLNLDDNLGTVFWILTALWVLGWGIKASLNWYVYAKRHLGRDEPAAHRQLQGEPVQPPGRDRGSRERHGPEHVQAGHPRDDPELRRRPLRDGRRVGRDVPDHRHPRPAVAAAPDRRRARPGAHWRPRRRRAAGNAVHSATATAATFDRASPADCIAATTKREGPDASGPSLITGCWLLTGRSSSPARRPSRLYARMNGSYRRSAYSRSR